MGELQRNGMQTTKIFPFSLCLTRNGHQRSRYEAISKEEGPRACEEMHQPHWILSGNSARMREPRMGMGRSGRASQVLLTAKWTMTPQATGPDLGVPVYPELFSIVSGRSTALHTSLHFPTEISAHEFPPIPMKQLISYYIISLSWVSCWNHHNSLPFQHSPFKPVPL